MATQPKVTVVKDADKVIDIKIMEDAIIQVAKGAQTLLSSRLTNRAILVLIKDSMPSPGLPLKDIKMVLDCASRLDKSYLK